MGLTEFSFMTKLATQPDANLQRFREAQDAGTPSAYQQAIAELQEGRKSSHWIWFVIPQLRGLGQSPTAKHFGIADLCEARSYLADKLLSKRLEQVIAIIADQLLQPNQTLIRLMGSDLDANKTISSLTLFEAAGLASATPLLNQLSQRCQTTIALLNKS